MSTRDFLKEVIPTPIIKFIRCWQMGLPKVRLEQYRRIQKIKKENHATVVFLVASLPMWRYQGVLDILATDKRFDVSIVIVPFALYALSEKEKVHQQIEDYFKQQNVEIYDATTKDNAIVIAEKLDPDIIFYPQHYSNLFKNCWDFQHYKDRLICYIPYALYTLDVDWAYLAEFNTVAWRMYFASSIHKDNAKRYSYEYGRNVKVVGEPHADDFLNSNGLCPWPDNGKKRVIYAPHFQIVPNDMFYRPSFLWTYDVMLDIAKQYSDKLQISFKPHPRLFSELCKNPEWGEERARTYYEQWKNMPNTQFEDGDFIDLFKGSDALIHDCGSFTAEYQYTQKPCMFLTKDLKSVRDELCRFGKGCLDNHYIGSSTDDVKKFITEVVFGENDPKKEQRQKFYKDYLLPPNAISTAENVYNDIVKSLFG